jgi:hypothetical protein
VQPREQLLAEAICRDGERDEQEPLCGLLDRPGVGRPERDRQAQDDHVRNRAVELDPGLIGRDAPEDGDAAPARKRGEQRGTGQRDARGGEPQRAGPKPCAPRGRSQRRDRDLESGLRRQRDRTVLERRVEDHQQQRGGERERGSHP